MENETALASGVHEKNIPTSKPNAAFCVPQQLVR